MDREEYGRLLNEILAEVPAMPREEAHYLVAKRLDEKLNTKYHRVCALWPPKVESTKVAFEGNTEEEVKIPKGAKILLFYNNSEHPDAPTYRVTWTW